MLAIASTWLEGVCLSKSLLYAYGTEENDVHNQSHTLFQIIISTLGQFAAYWQMIRLDVWRIYNQIDRLSSPHEIVYDLMINFVYLHAKAREKIAVNGARTQNLREVWRADILRLYWYAWWQSVIQGAELPYGAIWNIVRVVRMTISDWLTFYKSP